MTKNAYVTLVMRGDSYIMGAVCLAYSLKMHNCKHDIICMVTNDVSKNGHIILESIFTKVIVVDYIYADVYTKDGSLHKYHDQCTKFNLLTFTEYDKILFLDADIIAVDNIDDIFDIKTPAFHFARQYWNLRNMTTVVNGENKTGYIIKNEELRNKIRKISPFTGGLFLISPSKDHFIKMMELLKYLQPLLSLSTFMETVGPDEYILFLLYTCCLRSNISVISIEYLTGSITLPYPMKFCNKMPKLIHYYRDKPWTFDSFGYPDVGFWWNIFFNYSKTIDSKILSYIDEIKFKLVSIPKDKRIESTLITSGNLLESFIKSKLGDNQCLYCTSYNRLTSKKIDDNHIMSKCKYLNPL